MMAGHEPGVLTHLLLRLVAEMQGAGLSRAEIGDIFRDLADDFHPAAQWRTIVSDWGMRCPQCQASGPFRVSGTDADSRCLCGPCGHSGRLRHFLIQ